MDTSENELGISLGEAGISLDDFKEAKANAYNMLEKPPSLNLSKEGYLVATAISSLDISLITRFYKELRKVNIKTCNVCNRY